MADQMKPDNIDRAGLSIGQAAEVLARDFPDVTVSSLRFLESRGLIMPDRNAGGHRVFHLQDMLRIRRIKQLQVERNSLEEIHERLQRSLSVTGLAAAVEEITAALLKGNIRQAMARLEDVRLTDTPLLTIFDEVLTPVMRNLGDDEGNHLIPVDLQFEFDEELIDFIAGATVLPEIVTGKPVVLAACPPWERHDLPLRMLVAVLRERGAAVHFIGSQVESEFAKDANIRLQPNIILVSLTIPPSRMAHRWFEDLVQSMRPNQQLLIGGLGASSLRIAEQSNVDVVGLASYAEMIQRILA